MAATPNSAAMMSDVEPSSPVYPEKSFMTAVTEDGDSRMGMATPEPTERQPRGKKRGRDDANGANASTIGKVRHLKKEDGEPLWRKDIQFDFLRAVFDNDKCVFTNTYEPDRLGKQTFADLYIDTMSRSSKTSKVLRDKLLSDREAAKGMAMVCLLVNIGRMNTTLNCVPCPSPFVYALLTTARQSSLRCEPSSAPTTPYPHSKPVKTRTPTNSCRTLPD
jgi:Ino eighty subunit 1